MVIKNRNFLSVAEKRRFEKFASESAVNEAIKLGGKDFGEAIAGLLDKGLVTCKRMESGEWQFFATTEGKAMIELIHKDGGFDEE